MGMFYDIRKAWVFGLIATVSMVETFKGIDYANNTKNQKKVKLYSGRTFHTCILRAGF
jgi:hypothetical protein